MGYRNLQEHVEKLSLIVKKKCLILISGSGTPVRKISAHEFERGGLTKPLVTTVDGSPTFLSLPSPTNGDGVDSRGHALIRKRSRHDIKGG